MIIIGIGKNYINHESERPEEKDFPFIFTKPESTLLTENKNFKIPEVSKDVIYEVELAFRIGKDGKSIQREDVMEHIDGVGLAIDFTARDILGNSRKVQGPWALAKAFDGATPISSFLPMDNFINIDDINFSLTINGKPMQTGHSSLMIYSLVDIVELVSQFMPLHKGDIILSGTPAHGVDAINAGDHLIAKLEDNELLNFKVD